MITRFACGLITLLGVSTLKPAAYATFHLMQIEQIMGGVTGNTTAQAIQLRMRAAGENFVSGGKLVVFDAAGLNPITIVDPVTNVANGAVGDHVLIASATYQPHHAGGCPRLHDGQSYPGQLFRSGQPLLGK